MVEKDICKAFYGTSPCIGSSGRDAHFSMWGVAELV